MAESTFVSQSRWAVGPLVLELGLLAPVPGLLVPVPGLLVLGLLILVLAVLKLGPEVPGLGLGVTWGVTLVVVVG